MATRGRALRTSLEMISTLTSSEITSAISRKRVYTVLDFKAPTNSKLVGHVVMKTETLTRKKKKKQRDNVVEDTEAGYQTGETEESFSDNLLSISVDSLVSQHRVKKHKNKSLQTSVKFEDVSDNVVLETETPRKRKHKKKKRDVGMEGADGEFETSQMEESFNGEISVDGVCDEHRVRKQNKRSLEAPAKPEDVCEVVVVLEADPPKRKRKKKNRDVFVEEAEGGVSQTLECPSSTGKKCTNNSLDDPTDHEITEVSTPRVKKKPVNPSYLSPISTSASVEDSFFSEGSVSGRKKKHRHTEDMKNGSFLDTSTVFHASDSIMTSPELSMPQNEVTNSDLDSNANTRAKKHKKKKRALSSDTLNEQLENSSTLRRLGDETQGLAASDASPSQNEPTDNAGDKTGNLTPCSQKKTEFKNLSSLRQRDVDLLQEYFPKLKMLSKSTVHSLVREELERIRDAKRQAIKFNTGRFTEKENEQIRQNVKEFLTFSGIENEEKLFHSYRYPEERLHIERLKKKFYFRHRMGQGIARPLADVCHRGVKMFDLSGQKGQYTEDEVKELKKQWSLHGNKWTTVANVLGRSNVTVQLKASQLRREKNHGTWKVAEINRLIEAVKQFVLAGEKEEAAAAATGTKEELAMIAKQKLYKGIPWVQIEEKVKTRNWSQCKTKWTEILSLRMNNGFSLFEGVTGLRMKIKIITWLREREFTETSQVDWEEFANAIGNIPPLWLQTKVYVLKSRHVTGWQNMTFTEIVDHLYTVTLPVLEAQLSKSLSKKDENEELFEIRKDYSPAEIFYEYVEKENDPLFVKTKRKRRSV